MVENKEMSDEDLNEEYVQLRMAFPKLKMVCDPIATNPTNKTNAANLKSVLKGIEQPILQKYCDYLFIPTFLHLSNSRSMRDDTLCCVLECLQVILNHVQIDNEAQFWKICTVTFQIIFSETDDDYASRLPEEVKLLVVQCLTLLFKNSTDETLREVYTRQSIGRLSVVIYHTVQLAKREKFIKLRVVSLRCIQFILQLRSGIDTPSNLRRQIAEMAMLMLPGIVSCAVSVATSTDTLNHKVIVEALHLWGRVIGLVMEDRDTSSKDETITFKYCTDPGGEVPVGKSLHKGSTDPQDVKMSDDWLVGSGRKLVGATEKMLGLQQHDHWRVRRQLVSEINYVLSIAPKNMSLSVKYLVDALICLSQDVNDDVAEGGVAALDKFAKSCELDSGSKKLKEIVEESFYSLVTKMPRVIHGVDLSLKEKQLLLLAGYIDVLGTKHLPSLLNSSQHLNRLLKSLYTAATLDCTNLSLLEEQAVRELDQEALGLQKVWLNLKHSNSPRYLTILQSIAKKLLKYSESGSIVHSILDDFENDYFYRKEISLLLNLMFSTDNDVTVMIDRELINHVLKTIMEYNLWDLSIQVQSMEEKRQAQDNVVQVGIISWAVKICLLTELVALLAVAEGAKAFSPHLLSCLYPLLECAGSPLYSISSAGFASVGTLASLYGGDVGNLVAQNVDYLSHHVTLNLRRAHRNPRVLSVLSVIMNHSSFEVFPPLYEIVKDVLVQSCDTFQDVNASAFLHVFLTFVSRLLDWEKHSDNVPLEPCPAVSTTSVWDQFYDFYQTSLVAREYKDDNQPSEHVAEEEYDHPMDESYQEKKPKIPDHVLLTVEILNRSLHFLPSKDVARQVQVLQILEKGTLVLSRWKEQLLPMVHKIWSPLVQRFSFQSDPLIIHQSFIVLCTLATTSKDFIRTRTSKEVVPFLCKYLGQKSEETSKERDSSYRMSQWYKLVLTLLRGLGEFAVSLDLADDETERIVEAVIPYLSSLQPHPLQEAACDTIRVLFIKDPHVIWVQLMNACPNISEFTSTTPSLFPYKVESSFTNQEELQNNVHMLLGELK